MTNGSWAKLPQGHLLDVHAPKKRGENEKWREKKALSHIKVANKFDTFFSCCRFSFRSISNFRKLIFCALNAKRYFWIEESEKKFIEFFRREIIWLIWLWKRKTWFASTVSTEKCFIAVDGWCQKNQTKKRPFWFHNAPRRSTTLFFKKATRFDSTRWPRLLTCSRIVVVVDEVIECANTSTPCRFYSLVFRCMLFSGIWKTSNERTNIYDFVSLWKFLISFITQQQFRTFSEFPFLLSSAVHFFTPAHLNHCWKWKMVCFPPEKKNWFFFCACVFNGWLNG